jgi:tryptophan synthase alpha chain
MNRIEKLFIEKTSNILSVYFTAGYPDLDSTEVIIRTLAESGVDMVEVGIPFSDPMADGPVIQRSNEKALKNGMNLKLLFDQLSEIRNKVRIPILLMGYLNPVLQFGVENFCRMCAHCGIDGVILPDLPPQIYYEEYLHLFNKYDLRNICLISPQSTPDRISEIDSISSGFIYMVSSSAVTGSQGNFDEKNISYFRRVSEMKLKNPCLIGFGIFNRETLMTAGKYARGGIIGSAFVRTLAKEGDPVENIFKFVEEVR